VTDAAAWAGMADGLTEALDLQHILLSQAQEIKTHARFNVQSLAQSLEAIQQFESPTAHREAETAKAHRG